MTRLKRGDIVSMHWDHGAETRIGVLTEAPRHGYVRGVFKNGEGFDEPCVNMTLVPRPSRGRAAGIPVGHEG